LNPEPFITSRKFDSRWATSIMPASQRARAANKLEGKPKGFGQVWHHGAVTGGASHATASGANPSAPPPPSKTIDSNVIRGEIGYSATDLGRLPPKFSPVCKSRDVHHFTFAPPHPISFGVGRRCTTTVPRGDHIADSVDRAVPQLFGGFNVLP
jgi:hypothetical protein